MADIFNRNVSSLAGVFTADRAKLTMAANLGVLVQRMQFTYAQAITRLYEVGANGPGGASNIYYVGGRTQGNLTLDRVIGPSGSVKLLYRQYGDVCQARKNPIIMTLAEADCTTGASTPERYTMKNCVITQVSVGVSAQDMIIGENTVMMYSSLEAD